MCGRIKAINEVTKIKDAVPVRSHFCFSCLKNGDLVAVSATACACPTLFSQYSRSGSWEVGRTEGGTIEGVGGGAEGICCPDGIVALATSALDCQPRFGTSASLGTASLNV